MTTKYVSYVRVSTAKQGASGLGLEAQQTTVQQYLTGQGATADDHLREFVEVESGAHNDRPQLAAALMHAELTGAVLLVAKLDRLSRDVGFINAVMKSNVNFIACDLPIVNSFIIHVFAALAEYERGLISQRTKSALSSLRDRGVKLGSPNNLTTAAAAAGRTAGSETRRRKADTYARKIGPLVTRYRDKGMSLRDIAAQLTADQMLTPGGKGAWTASAVRSVLQRCAV